MTTNVQNSLCESWIIRAACQDSPIFSPNFSIRVGVLTQFLASLHLSQSSCASSPAWKGIWVGTGRTRTNRAYSEQSTTSAIQRAEFVQDESALALAMEGKDFYSSSCSQKFTHHHFAFARPGASMDTSLLGLRSPHQCQVRHQTPPWGTPGVLSPHSKDREAALTFFKRKEKMLLSSSQHFIWVSVQSVSVVFSK